MNLIRIESSFKDPLAQVFMEEQTGEYYRVFKGEAAGDFLLFLHSDLYNEVKGFFPEFEIVRTTGESILIKVQKIEFFSYYFEWSFEMVKDSALFYLKIQTALIKKGFILVDATPLNITFLNSGKMIYFDLGSIRKYNPKTGWSGFKQFIESFLYPLYILSNPKISAGLVQNFINRDIPGELFNLIPLRLWFRPSFWFIVKLHRKIHSNKKINESHLDISAKKTSMTFMFFESLVSGIRKSINNSRWSEYNSNHILTKEYAGKKIEIISSFLSKCDKTGSLIIDWGANQGIYSELASCCFPQCTVLSIDSDNDTVNALYKRLKKTKNNIITLFLNITNLTPSMGWMNKEYKGFKDRYGCSAFLQMGLALVHHLQHRLNLSYAEIASFFDYYSKEKGFLIIEFISEDDPKHQLIRNPNYPYEISESVFVESFEKHFQIILEEKPCPTRTIYLMRKF